MVQRSRRPWLPFALVACVTVGAAASDPLPRQGQVAPVAPGRAAAQEVEPNDTPPQAQVLAPPVVLSAAFAIVANHQDDDRYAVDVTRAGVYAVRITMTDRRCRFWVANDVTAGSHAAGEAALTIEADGRGAVQGSLRAAGSNEQRGGRSASRVVVSLTAEPYRTGGGVGQCAAEAPSVSAIPYSVAISFSPATAPVSPVTPAPVPPKAPPTSPASPPGGPDVPARLEDRAFALGQSARAAAGANPASADRIVADAYRQALALGSTTSEQQAVKAAFVRGYGSVPAGPPSMASYESFEVERIDSLAGLDAPSAGTTTSYAHPTAGFRLDPPPGWRVDEQAAPADLRLTAPGGDGLVEISSGPVPGPFDPVSYAAGWESVSVGPTARLKVKTGGQVLVVDGERGYAGHYEAEGVSATVVFVGVEGRFFVITAVFPRGGASEGAVAFEALLKSFRLPRSGDPGARAVAFAVSRAAIVTGEASR
jgi:hypothetical protein